MRDELKGGTKSWASVYGGAPKRRGIDVMELTELIELARKRDLDAFEEIVRRFQDMACGYAYSRLGDFHLAEDAAQEAFVEAFRDLPDLREPLAFPSWLRRIVFKRCHRMTRRKHVGTAPLESGGEATASEPSPEEASERRELRDAVLAAVRALPETQRTVTTLFYINGYSQKDIAAFLDLPVATVNNRLHASRGRLKERMIAMVEQDLKANAPDERFSKRIIRELLARPRPLEVPGHPVRQVWELIRGALPEYEVIDGPEIVAKGAFAVVKENMDRAYHFDDQHALRTQTSITTLKAIKGRQPPIRLLAVGRVFRPDPEDATRLKVFHQMDAVCIGRGVDVRRLRAKMQLILNAVFGAPVEVRWREHSYGFVQDGLEADLKIRGKWVEVSGSGTLTSETLREAGYDPQTVAGFTLGMGLERLAMLRFGIQDIRALWRPPYL
jgi:RNA polymerase sigma factor (sigma-70 family)